MAQQGARIHALSLIFSYVAVICSAQTMIIEDGAAFVVASRSLSGPLTMRLAQVVNVTEAQSSFSSPIRPPGFMAAGEVRLLGPSPAKPAVLDLGGFWELTVSVLSSKGNSFSVGADPCVQPGLRIKLTRQHVVPALHPIRLMRCTAVHHEWHQHTVPGEHHSGRQAHDVEWAGSWQHISSRALWACAVLH